MHGEFEYFVIAFCFLDGVRCIFECNFYILRHFSNGRSTLFYAKSLFLYNRQMQMSFYQLYFSHAKSLGKNKVRSYVILKLLLVILSINYFPFVICSSKKTEFTWFGKRFMVFWSKLNLL